MSNGVNAEKERSPPKAMQLFEEKEDGICNSHVPNHSFGIFSCSRSSSASCPAFLDSVRQVRSPLSCVPWHARAFGIVRDGNLYRLLKHRVHCKQFWFNLDSSNSSPAIGFLHPELRQTEICARSAFSVLLCTHSTSQWRLKMFESMLGEPEGTTKVHKTI